MDKEHKATKSTILEDSGINEGLIKDSKVHTNLAQEVVITTEDKIRICLTKYLNKMGKKSSWIAPFGIFLTIVITMLTTTFKNAIFSADTWNAVFIIVGAISFGWLIISLKNIGVSVEIDDVIGELKKGSPIKKDPDRVFYVVDRDNKFIGVRNSEGTHILRSTTTPKNVLNIVKATYGASGNNVDVTEKLKEMVEDGKLNTKATNALVDKDPVPGIVKTLNVTYEFNGVMHHEQFVEGHEVILPNPEK